MTVRDPGERQVWCRECNAYLHSESVFEGPGVHAGNDTRLVGCPTKTQCEEQSRRHGPMTSTRRS